MTVGRIRLLLGLMVLSVGLWTVFAKLVVPAVIESAYRGESWWFLNRMISGQATHPVSDYLQDWDSVAIRGLLGSLGFWLIVLVISHPAFSRWIVGEATPGSLGAIRMWTCTILLLVTLQEDLASIALLPVEMRRPTGMMQYFYALPIGFDSIVTSEMTLQAFQWLTELILFLGAIGWRTRVMIPLGALCYLLFEGILRDYSNFYHSGLTPLYVIAVLSCTPCGDGWSVDRLRKVYQGKAVPDAEHTSPVYGWSRYVCWVVIALPYVASGLSKLRDGGLYWWDATNMRSMLYKDSLNPSEFDWALSLHLTSAPDIVFALFGGVALIGEVSFGLVLFSRTARRFLPLFMMIMHVGILLFQRILFLDLILLQFVFFDFTRIRKAAGQLEAGNSTNHSPGTLVYTLNALMVCGLTLVMSYCWFYRTEFYPFSAMQMYAGMNTSGVIQYFKVLAHRDSGVISPARLEDGIGALAHDSRYRRVLSQCFEHNPQKDVDVCKRFLTVNASAYNRIAPWGEKITQYEIQLWRWDFRSNPSDPHYGKVVERFVLEIERAEM